jgi:hypothetical protein
MTGVQKFLHANGPDVAGTARDEDIHIDEG